MGPVGKSLSAMPDVNSSPKNPPARTKFFRKMMEPLMITTAVFAVTAIMSGRLQAQVTDSAALKADRAASFEIRVHVKILGKPAESKFFPRTIQLNLNTPLKPVPMIITGGAQMAHITEPNPSGNFWSRVHLHSIVVPPSSINGAGIFVGVHYHF